jgi:hypothetical protein
VKSNLTPGWHSSVQAPGGFGRKTHEAEIYLRSRVPRHRRGQREKAEGKTRGRVHHGFDSNEKLSPPEAISASQIEAPGVEILVGVILRKNFSSAKSTASNW